MQFTTATIVSIALLCGPGLANVLQKRQDAVVQFYAGSGCSGDAKSADIPDGGCISFTGTGSAQQNKGDNGIKYTCNAYTDSACKNKLGEVYDCVSGTVGSINCYENPPL